MSTKQVILGVDPGTIHAGFGIMQVTGGQVVLHDCGVLSMSSKFPLTRRVRMFHDFFHEKIVQHHVAVMALETPFLGKNPQNFLKLGYMRGILYLLNDIHGIVLREFSPSEVKKSVTGYGGADKEQVARLMMRLFPALRIPERYDMTDAVAVTLCAAWSSIRSPIIMR